MTVPSFSFCWVHGIEEHLPLEPYEVCSECGHVYRTSLDLLDAFNTRVACDDEDTDELFGLKIAKRTLDQAHTIITCPHCGHDF